MQTILGAGGAIGKEIAIALTKYTDSIRLVARNPQKVNENDQLFSADLLNPHEVLKAVEDSEVVYLTVGLSYNTKIWQNCWPRIMRNVIDACKAHHAKLVFFDNIYMYDPDHLGNMTEETPVNPVSKKGFVRARIAQMLLDEIANGTLRAVIVRSADFYGPSIKKVSVLTETVLNNLAAGKKANWLMSLNKKHSYTYTPDAGKATALIGNANDAYNQVWHLPTASNPLTGGEWIEAISKQLNVTSKRMVLSKSMVKLTGIIIPVMREIVEMLYQYDRDYVFISDKFSRYFNFTPTSYYEGIKEIIERDYSQNRNI